MCVFSLWKIKFHGPALVATHARIILHPGGRILQAETRKEERPRGLFVTVLCVCSHMTPISGFRVLERNEKRFTDSAAFLFVGRVLYFTTRDNFCVAVIYEYHRHERFSQITYIARVTLQIQLLKYS